MLHQQVLNLSSISNCSRGMSWEVSVGLIPWHGPSTSTTTFRLFGCTPSSKSLLAFLFCHLAPLGTKEHCNIIHQQVSHACSFPVDITYALLAQYTQRTKKNKILTWHKIPCITQWLHTAHSPPLPFTSDPTLLSISSTPTSDTPLPSALWLASRAAAILHCATTSTSALHLSSACTSASTFGHSLATLALVIWCSSAAFSSAIHLTSATFTPLSTFAFFNLASIWATLSLSENMLKFLGERMISSLQHHHHLCWIVKLWWHLSIAPHHVTSWLICTWHIMPQQLSTLTHDLQSQGLGLRGEILLDPIPTPISVPSTLFSVQSSCPVPGHPIITSVNWPLIMSTLFKQYFDHCHILSSHCQCHWI